MNNSAFMENLRQLFAECDTDQNGSLGRQEFSELCSKIGLNREAAAETFDRLDVDKDDKITFDEFAAGFNHYKQAGSQSGQLPSPTTNPSPSPRQQQQQQQQQLASNGGPAAPSGASKTQVPARFLANNSNNNNTDHPHHHHHASRLSPNSLGQQQQHHAAASGSSRTKKAASPIGVLSLGSTGSSGSSSSAGASYSNSLSLGHSQASGGAPSSLTSSRSAASGLNHSIQELAISGPSSTGATLDYAHQTACDDPPGAASNSTIVYSSDMIDDCYHEAASGSGQFGSMLSNGSSSYNQLKTMQDLMECVQKLQNENQILTQIFFRDKREREEYISQLGEEFDQQLREVEARANKRAREELEQEKKRLRDMMQAERETLEQHYQTLEKMSKLVRSPAANGGAGGPDGETTIDKVKSKLEDTYMENRQLKRSLLDTKTDVAMIWKEMEKLKKQYEEKLSSAYEKHNETKHECDHIKQQLTLMKDSNRRLQDASDVITNYITDKVEPIIKVANELGDEAQLDSNYLGASSASIASRLSGASPSGSRRGSILSEYLNNGQDNEDDDDDGDNFNKIGQLSKGGQRNRGPAEDASNNLRPASSCDARATGGGGGGKTTNTTNLKGSASESRLANDTTTRGDDSKTASKSDLQQQQHQQQPTTTTTTTTTTNANQEQSGLKSSTSNALKSIGRHFMLGSSSRSASTEADKQANSNNNNSKHQASVGQQVKTEQQQQQPKAGNKLEPEITTTTTTSAEGVPMIEPADGPSRATFNVILVGDSFVGKSSFAARFMEGTFVQGLISNCSIDFKTKSYKVDGVNYTINLWDTAGQERFRSITASYFRKADGIILMYDVTDKRSYLNVRNWMSTIADTTAENVAVLLVGNKIDLRTQSNVAKCVPTEEGHKLANEYEVVFLETSVKTGTNLLPSMGRLISLIAKSRLKGDDDEEDKDRIKLNAKDRSFQCMPKNC